MEKTSRNDIPISHLLLAVMQKWVNKAIPFLLVMAMACVCIYADIDRESTKVRAVTNGGVVLYRLRDHGPCDKAREYLLSQGVVFREFVFDGQPLPLIGAPSCPACFPVILVDGIRINGFRPKAIRAALDAQKSPSAAGTFYAQSLSLMEQLGL